MTANPDDERATFVRGYRAALERMYATLRTDPLAEPPGKAYRNAVGAEVVQLAAGEQSRNQRLEQRLVAVTKDLVRLTRGAKVAAAAAARSQATQDDLDAANAEINRLQRVIADLELPS